MKLPNPMTEQIMQILRREYAALDDAGEEAISPEVIARRVQLKLDPDAVSPALMGWAGVLELRQLARSICRRVSNIDDPEDTTQIEMFDGQLQRRYPAVRNGSEQYVLRERLTLAERRANTLRLRKEAQSKNLHADALEAETEKLIARGDFDAAA